MYSFQVATVLSFELVVYSSSSMEHALFMCFVLCLFQVVTVFCHLSVTWFQQYGTHFARCFMLCLSKCLSNTGFLCVGGLVPVAWNMLCYIVLCLHFYHSLVV